MAGLGRTVSVFRGTFSAGGWLWYVGGLATVGGAMLIGKAGLALISGGQPEDLATGPISVVVGLLLLLVPVARWRQSVTLYEDGLVWKKLTGEVSLARHEVSGVQLTHHITRMGNYHEVEITLGDGRTRSITGIDNAEQLSNLLHAWTRAPAGAPSPAGWAPPAAAPGRWHPPGG